MNTESARLQAQDDNTAPEILTELSTSRDYLTRQYVTANPNTPTETLLKLGTEFPRELFNNPLFCLLILEDIDFVNKIPLPTLRSILRQQDVPAYILEQAGDRADLEVQLSLVNRLATTTKTLEKLTTSKYPEVIEAANLHISLVSEIHNDYNPKAQNLIIKNIAKDKNYKLTVRLLSLLAQIINIPNYIMEILSFSSRYESMFDKLARSPTTPLVILEIIAHHNNQRIRDLSIVNHNLSMDTARLLIGKVSWIYQTRIASDINTPVDMLEQLSKVRAKSVRAAVAANISTPIKILNKLTTDVDSTTIKNARRSIAIKTDKYGDFLSNCGSRMYVQGSPNDERIYYIPVKTLEQIIDQHPNFVAEYPQTPEYLLVQLSQHKKWNVRQKIAANLRTPVHILEKLAYDESLDVRISIAKNNNTPLKVIFKELIRDVRINHQLACRLCNPIQNPTEQELELDRVKDLIAEESISSLEQILQRIINNCGTQAKVFLAQHSDLPDNLLTQLAHQSDFKVQKTVANNPHTSSSSLKYLASIDNVDLKQIIAKHLNTPGYILEMFAHHKSIKVRALAMANSNLTTEAVEQILCGEYAAEYPQYNPDYLKNQPYRLEVILNYYARSQSPLVSHLALLQSQVSPETLSSKSLSLVWLDRFAVAQNSRTRIEILDKLAQDSNQLVRAAAQHNISIKNQFN